MIPRSIGQRDYYLKPLTEKGSVFFKRPKHYVLDKDSSGRNHRKFH